MKIVHNKSAALYVSTEESGQHKMLFQLMTNLFVVDARSLELQHLLGSLQVFKGVCGPCDV